MKEALILLQMLSLNSLLAQDNIQTVKPSELSKGKVAAIKFRKQTPTTTAGKIEVRMNQFLDSMVRTADESPFFIQKIKSGTAQILFEYFRAGMLAGATVEQSYFVKCNAETMTARDIAEGRLVLLTGFATIKPSEFELLRFERILINKTPLQYASQY